MNGYSLRTMMLATAAMASVCGLLAAGGGSAWLVHLVLVLAFAVPGASYGFDRGGSSRGATIGAAVAAVLGTLLLSGGVLLSDFLGVLCS